MKTLHWVAWAAVCAGLGDRVTARQSNRLQLDNGGEVLWALNDPFIGSAPGTFDPTGDLYWKAFPADALQRCSGVCTLDGTEYTVWDLDWDTNDTVIWAHTITEGTFGTDGTIVPKFAGAGVFLPEVSNIQLGNPLGFGNCPPPAYVSGWVLQESFLDSASGSPTPLLSSMTCDGTVDWVFTHYFPSVNSDGTPMSISSPSSNSCGQAGDASLSWYGSVDSVTYGPFGENQPDWTTLGNSVYGGCSVGGDGAFQPISENIDAGQQVALVFQEPMLTVRADAGDGFGPEVGLIALETPLQVFSSGVPVGGTTTLGVRFYDQGASTSGTDFMLAAANVVPPFIDTFGFCIPFGGAGAMLGLSPLGGSGFSESFAVFSLNTPWTVDVNGETVNTSVQVPAGTSAVWVDLEIAWQAWNFSAVSGQIVSESQVFRNTMRPFDGL